MASSYESYDECDGHVPKRQRTEGEYARTVNVNIDSLRIQIFEIIRCQRLEKIE